MGKGDLRTAKGKRYNASYGNARRHVVKKAAVSVAAPVPKKTVVKTALTKLGGAKKETGKM